MKKDIISGNLREELVGSMLERLAVHEPSQVAKGLLKVLARDSSHFYVALIMKLYMK